MPLVNLWSRTDGCELGRSGPMPDPPLDGGVATLRLAPRLSAQRSYGPGDHVGGSRGEVALGED